MAAKDGRSCTASASGIRLEGVEKGPTILDHGGLLCLKRSSARSNRHMFRLRAHARGEEAAQPQHVGDRHWEGYTKQPTGALSKFEPQLIACPLLRANKREDAAFGRS